MKDFFSQPEFSRCDPPCKKGDMDKDFMNRLNVARFISDVPYVLTSAYRPVEHEKAQGRDGTSSHTKGIAVDIVSTTGGQRMAILRGLMAAGFTRIGIGEDFIHVDSDPDKVQKFIFTYYDNE